MGNLEYAGKLKNELSQDSAVPQQLYIAIFNHLYVNQLHLFFLYVKSTVTVLKNKHISCFETIIYMYLKKIIICNIFLNY
jgi:hypothetical protein